MSRAIDTEHYNGVYWKDIDWRLPIHIMDVCDSCGITSDDEIMGGHLTFCQYLYSNQESTAGRTFLREKICEALIREGKIDASHSY